MIKKDGKFYVVVEFNSDFMAVGFETCIDQQKGVIVDHLGTVLPAKRVEDSEFQGDGVNNSVNGSVVGEVFQIGRCDGSINVSGRRVQ